MDYVLMGKQIRKRRRALKKTQEQLAEAVNLSTSFIGHIEHGTRKCSVETLYRICSDLDLDANVVIGLKPRNTNNTDDQPLEEQMQSIFDELRDLLGLEKEKRYG